MKTKSCVVIRHLQFEDLGSFAEPLTAAGYQLQYLDAAMDDLTAAYQADLTVILGGPVGVYDTALYPFLQTELLIAKQRLAEQRPLLGVCLGSQLIAAAAGAAVYPGAYGKEIGWSPIRFTQAARETQLFAVEDVDAELQMFHWHGDTFDLPAGAEFKFLPTLGSWDGDWGADAANAGRLIQDGEANLSGYESGKYVVAVNFNTLSYTVSKITGVPANLYLVGGFNGWSNTAGNPQFTQTSAGVFEITQTH